MKNPPEFAYGVTTVASRAKTTLLPTLQSLAAAGFNRPMLFVDGPEQEHFKGFNYEKVFRSSNIRMVGNWMLSLMELLIRHPSADRYIIFQDDLIAAAGLREYLEKSKLPDKAYFNLYGDERNYALIPKTGSMWGRFGRGRIGWFESNQLGLGALALMFTRPVVIELFRSEHMYKKVTGGGSRAWSSIDGGVVAALKQAGIREWCHNPCLVQHTGDRSTKGHYVKTTSNYFIGKRNAAEMLQPGASLD